MKVATGLRLFRDSPTSTGAPDKAKACESHLMPFPFLPLLLPWWAPAYLLLPDGRELQKNLELNPVMPQIKLILFGADLTRGYSVTSARLSARIPEIGAEFAEYRRADSKSG